MKSCNESQYQIATLMLQLFSSNKYRRYSSISKARYRSKRQHINFISIDPVVYGEKSVNEFSRLVVYWASGFTRKQPCWRQLLWEYFAIPRIIIDDIHDTGHLLTWPCTSSQFWWFLVYNQPGLAENLRDTTGTSYFGMTRGNQSSHSCYSIESRSNDEHFYSSASRSSDYQDKSKLLKVEVENEGEKIT